MAWPAEPSAVRVFHYVAVAERESCGRSARVASPFYIPHALESPRLARKPNYDYEKRRKEMERQAKKDAKREERARRKLLGLPDEMDEAIDPLTGLPVEPAEEAGPETP